MESKEDTIESHEENFEAWNIHKEEYEELHDSQESHVMESEKEVLIIQVAAYRHPHYFKKQQSLRTSWVQRKKYYGPRGNQQRKQYGDECKTTRNIRRYQRNATSSWNHRRTNQDQGIHEAVRPCIQIPLEWMDVHAWNH